MQQEEFRQQQRIKTQTQSRSAEQYEAQTGNFCPKCGAYNEPGSMFCEECGAGLNSVNCPSCGKELIPGADVCEHCGTYVKKEHCGFCGSGMAEDDAYCPECGEPAAGITCPNCGTLNHGGFCKKCSTPLSELAKIEVQKALKEPAYQQVLALSDEITQLEQQLKEIENDIVEPEEEIIATPPPTKPEVPKTAKQLERERKNEELKQMYLQLSNGSMTPSTAPAPPPVSPQPEAPKRQKMEKKSKGDVEAIIKQKRAEMQQLLDSMKPDESATPQMVRNYFTARRPPVSDSVWECKYSTSLHPNPSHCGKPILGGKWVVVYEKIVWEYGMGL